jgi:hypothetical protein
VEGEFGLSSGRLGYVGFGKVRLVQVKLGYVSCPRGIQRGNGVWPGGVHLRACPWVSDVVGLGVSRA